MLVDLENATSIVRNEFPNSVIGTPVDYNGIWLFQIVSPLPDEGGWDPFISVDQKTGELKDFNPMFDGNIFEISELFLASRKE